MEHLGAGRDCGIEERPDHGSIPGVERDVDLAVRHVGREGPDPEGRHSTDAEPDGRSELKDASPAQGGEHGVVEARAPVRVLALNREMVEHEQRS